MKIFLPREKYGLEINPEKNIIGTSVFLKENNIKFVRVLFCDNANIIRSKAFHIDVLPEHFDTGVSITVAQQAFPVMYDAVITQTGLAPVGEAWIVPDWSTLNLLPYAPTHARVIGDIFKNEIGRASCRERV